MNPLIPAAAATAWLASYRQSQKTGSKAEIDIYEGTQPITWPVSSMPEGVNPNENDFVKKLKLHYNRRYWLVIKTFAKYMSTDDFGQMAWAILYPPSPQFRAKFIQEGLKGRRFASPKQREREKARLGEAFDTVFQSGNLDVSNWKQMYSFFNWYKSGSNIVVVGENMQRLFEYTSLKGLKIKDIEIPSGQAIYVALPNFKGLIDDELSGEHEIRGVLIVRQPMVVTFDTSKSIQETEDSLNFYVWGKPKLLPQGQGAIASHEAYEDTFTDTIASLRLHGDTPLDEFMEDTMSREGTSHRGMVPRKKVMLEGKYRLSNQMAIRIAVNVLVYWNAMDKGGQGIPQPLKEEQDRYLAKLMKKRRKAGKREKARLDKKIEDFNANRKRWYYIDKSLIPKSTVVNPRGPLGGKRASPHVHIVSGHWRTYPSGKKVFIAPHMRGSGDPPEPKFWKSLLD